MPLSIDVAADGAWSKIYEETKDIVRTGPTSYLPIAPIEIPFLLESNIIAIGTSSDSAKPTWWLGGTVIQKVDTTVVGGSIELHREKAQLNKVKMLVLPKYTETFKIEFQVPPWIEDLTLAVWEFQGFSSDAQIDQIEAARAQLTTLDAKLNALPEQIKDVIFPIDAGEENS